MNYANNVESKVCLQQLNAIYKEKGKGIKNTRKCKWYGYGEKSIKFLLNLENHHAIQTKIHFVVINKDKIKDQAEINKDLFYFYQSLFRCKVHNPISKV